MSRNISTACLFACAATMSVACFHNPAKASPPIFRKGTQTWTLSGAYTQERTGDDQYLAAFTLGRGLYVIDNAALDVQMPIYYAHDEQSAAGIGLQAVARYHFLNINRFSLYGDILGGLLWTSDDFPAGGTELNFTYAAGPGASFQLNERVHIIFGYRFQHISNGFIKGRDRNPIMNSLGGYIGLLWTF
jgi:opacity protein-like surface antigen